MCFYTHSFILTGSFVRAGQVAYAYIASYWSRYHQHLEANFTSLVWLGLMIALVLLSLIVGGISAELPRNATTSSSVSNIVSLLLGCSFHVTSPYHIRYSRTWRQHFKGGYFGGFRKSNRESRIFEISFLLFEKKAFTRHAKWSCLYAHINRTLWMKIQTNKVNTDRDYLFVLNCTFIVECESLYREQISTSAADPLISSKTLGLTFRLLKVMSVWTYVLCDIHTLLLRKHASVLTFYNSYPPLPHARAPSCDEIVTPMTFAQNDPLHYTC